MVIKIGPEKYKTWTDGIFNHLALIAFATSILVLPMFFMAFMGKLIVTHRPLQSAFWTIDNVYLRSISGPLFILMILPVGYRWLRSTYQYCRIEEGKVSLFWSGVPRIFSNMCKSKVIDQYRLVESYVTFFNVCLVYLPEPDSVEITQGIVFFRDTKEEKIELKKFFDSHFSLPKVRQGHANQERA